MICIWTTIIKCCKISIIFEMIKVAINGFGRIGRSVLRTYAEQCTDSIFKIVAVNAATPSIEDRLYNLKYDSVHGTLQNVVQLDSRVFSINNCAPIKMLFERDIAKLPWKDLGIEVVLECTGSFNDHASAALHIQNGAKKVIVSAPCKDADATIILGANESALRKEHAVISISSCTTNCLAPIAKILHNGIGIESGFMTTIHAYTNDQALLDSKHKDKRRSRAAALSIIPSSTGAAKSIGLVLPELAGKLDGAAVRVPVPNVSMIDLTFISSRETSVHEINSLVMSASKNIPSILSITDEELVSADINHNSSSAVFDLTQTKVVNKTFCRIAAWYDNEWGFANRMLDIIPLLSL